MRKQHEKDTEQLNKILEYDNKTTAKLSKTMDELIHCHDEIS